MTLKSLARRWFGNSPNRACTDGVLTVLPSSLDLLNSVVQECRPETADWFPPRAAASHSQEPGSKIQESGNLEIQESGNLGSKIMHKTKNVKIKVRVAQDVGKVWISRKKSSWPHLVAFQ